MRGFREFGDSGKLAESETIGQSSIIKTAEQQFRESSHEHSYHIHFREARDLVRGVQDRAKLPYDPAHPGGRRYPFAHELHAKVAEGLELSNEELQKGCLKLFTAVGSVLDKMHGVDGFLEYRLESGKVVFVYFDITANPLKTSAKSSEIALIEVPINGFDFDDQDDQQLFSEIVSTSAEEICLRFNRLLQSGDRGRTRTYRRQAHV
ncbi:hypothetical protein KKF32_00805 [Patescibacteria group bacterium]|nr:hypothetical protein [Patescibacteria group bacterium]